MDHPRPSPFLTCHFLQPWAKSFATELRLGCWQGRELILLHRTRTHWELLGGQEVADRLDGLGSSAEFWAALREEASHWDAPCSFPNLAPDAWALEHRGSGDRLEVTDQSPFVTLQGSFESYLEGLPKKHRHELRRKMRRAERLCERGLHVTHDDDLETFLRLHRLSSAPKAEFMGQSEQFFRDLTHSLRQAGMLRLSTVWDGTTALASMYQILFAGSVHLYNSGYHPEYASLAPGLVLLGYCLKKACLERAHEFDFLRGTERYKYDLGGVDRPVYRLTWEHS
jgi:CelD/BcsL family acetyltransferase involved in cellulose biosynthesis